MKHEKIHWSCCFALCSLRFALSAEAQQPTKIPRIGYLSAASPSANSARIEAFRQGLRELGYVEGKNIVIEWRSAEGKLDRLPALAAELVRLKVDVIVTAGPTATRAAKEATSTIPIVMTQDSDPVGKRVRRQPGATWRKHHWIVHPCPGAKRKTTGASEGDRSQALPRGRLRDFDRPGQRTNVKRDGTRRRGVRSEASIPRRTRVPRILRPHSEPQARGVLTQSSCCGGPRRHFSPNTDCRTRGKEPAPGDIRQARICGSRGAYDLRREHYRLGPARRYLRGQDSERRQARRSSRRAADEVRVHHQSESRQADRPDDSAECAGAGG